MIFHLQCLRCKKAYDLSEEAMNEIGYTKYSYCDDCLREGLELLKWDDEKKAGDIPFYVIFAGLGEPQTYHGMVMAWKDRRMAERQIEKGEQMDPGDIAYSGDVVRVYPLVPGGRVEGSWGCYNHEKYCLENRSESEPENSGRILLEIDKIKRYADGTNV